jgi:NDP-sugar pyrophosphorylase family protein
MKPIKKLQLLTKGIGWTEFEYNLLSDLKPEFESRGIKINSYNSVTIGYNTKIGNNATIGDWATIGHNDIIDAYETIEPHAMIGHTDGIWMFDNHLALEEASEALRRLRYNRDPFDWSMVPY